MLRMAADVCDGDPNLATHQDVHDAVSLRIPSDAVTLFGLVVADPAVGQLDADDLPGYATPAAVLYGALHTAVLAAVYERLGLDEPVDRCTICEGPLVLDSDTERYYCDTEACAVYGEQLDGAAT